MKSNQKLSSFQVAQSSSANYPSWFFNDTWQPSDLGVSIDGYSRKYILSFRGIRQDWLKYFIKKFVRLAASTKKLTTLREYLKGLNFFSRFLWERYPSRELDEIDRSLILDYLSYLNESKLGIQAKKNRLSTLQTFFETGAINGWFELPSYLILNEDFPKSPKSIPRYIPEEVIQQLNQHLNTLPEPVTRMVLVIQECGLRINELLFLPFDCLKQDPKGNWYIQFMRWKMSKESTIPISSELAAVVREQQRYIQENLGDNFQHLFCARKKTLKNKMKEFDPAPKVMREDLFRKFIKDLADEFDIRDNSGKHWEFQPHQFRHTVGTRMINSGVPQHIVQRYLGHESPTMTQVYAQIHDETLRKEVEKYHESRVVNIKGETVGLEKTVLASEDDLEWFKKNILAQALPNGYCGRPKVLGFCTLPPNSCLGCAHFRTNKHFLPIHKEELERTKQVIAKARDNGWEVQVSMNEPIRDNLEKVIHSLEEDKNEQKD